MWGIFLASAWMWVLILRRYYYFWVVFPRKREHLTSAWQEHELRNVARGLRLRRVILNQLSNDLSRDLSLIQTLALILPMIGLLGTVVGMIETFYAMTVFGMGNPRAVASGVSIALTTTLAGLCSALPGYFLSSEMRRGIRAELERVAKSLT